MEISKITLHCKLEVITTFKDSMIKQIKVKIQWFMLLPKKQYQMHWKVREIQEFLLRKSSLKHIQGIKVILSLTKLCHICKRETH